MNGNIALCTSTPNATFCYTKQGNVLLIGGQCTVTMLESVPNPPGLLLKKKKQKKNRWKKNQQTERGRERGRRFVSFHRFLLFIALYENAIRFAYFSMQIAVNILYLTSFVNLDVQMVDIFGVQLNVHDFCLNLLSM